MDDHRLELDGYSIIVVGSFNPAIFQPLWLSDNNLIRKEEANEAKIEIIHRQAAIFSTEWFSLQVTDDRFALETKDPTKSLPLRDLAFGAFKILEHTPIAAFGLNRIQHYSMSSMDRWHALGHHLAPKASWHALLSEPGMRLLIMEGKRANCDARIQVRIEPLDRLTGGVSISVNEHHDFTPLKDATIADRNRLFLEAIQEQWDCFMTYAGEVSTHLFHEVDKPAPHFPKKRKG